MARTIGHSSDKKDAVFSREFIGIFIVNTLLNLCIYTAYSQFPLYGQELGASANQIGVLLSTFAVAALIFRFVSGPAINSFDPKRILMASMLILAIAFAGYGFAPQIAGTFGAGALTVLKIFSFIQGVGNAFANACCLTLVSEILPRGRFNAGIAYYACARVISQAFGPSVGVFLSNKLGYEQAYYLISFCMICALLMTLSIKISPRIRSGKFAIKLSDAFAVEASIPVIIIALVSMSVMAVSSFLLIYAEARGIDGASWYFTVYALVMFVSRPILGKLIDRHGFVRVGVPSILLTSAALVAIAYADSLLVLLLGAVLCAFGYGGSQPALQSLCMKSVPTERRGSASCASFIGLDIATLTGPAICGYAAEAVGYTPSMWLIMTLPCCLGALVSVVFRVNINKIENTFNKN